MKRNIRSLLGLYKNDAIKLKIRECNVYMDIYIYMGLCGLRYFIRKMNTQYVLGSVLECVYSHTFATYSVV